MAPLPLRDVLSRTSFPRKSAGQGALDWTGDSGVLGLCGLGCGPGDVAFGGKTLSGSRRIGRSVATGGPAQLHYNVSGQLPRSFSLSDYAMNILSAFASVCTAAPAMIAFASLTSVS